jgi:hypothetical protein
MSCHCFDLCNDANAWAFVRSTRNVTLTADDSVPWTRYLMAVYADQVQWPYNLSSTNFFYLNSRAWRRLHPGAASPFRNCWLRWYLQPPCADSICAPWRKPLYRLASKEALGQISHHVMAWYSLSAVVL